MRLPLNASFFVKQPTFKFKSRTILLFIGFAIAAWGINVFTQIAFPSQRLIPFFVRTTTLLATDLALIYISFRLLKQNGLPATALGLSDSTTIIPSLFWGTLIGVIAISIIAGILFLHTRYYFVPGSMSGTQVLQESIFYLAGNTLEEIIFRGFLFIICSQLTGWRISAIIMAVLFGLFHLQGLGLTIDGLKIFSTTACYSFVFSFSFVLFRSLYAAISVHVVSNILLHSITGLDGANNAMFVPVFKGSLFHTYDAGFIIMIVTAIILSGLLYLSIMKSSVLAEKC